MKTKMIEPNAPTISFSEEDSNFLLNTRILTKERKTYSGRKNPNKHEKIFVPYRVENIHELRKDSWEEVEKERKEMFEDFFKHLIYKPVSKNTTEKDIGEDLSWDYEKKDEETEEGDENENGDEKESSPVKDENPLEEDTFRETYKSRWRSEFFTCMDCEQRYGEWENHIHVCRPKKKYDPLVDEVQLPRRINPKRSWFSVHFDPEYNKEIRELRCEEPHCKSDFTPEMEEVIDSAGKCLCGSNISVNSTMCNKCNKVKFHPVKKIMLRKRRKILT